MQKLALPFIAEYANDLPEKIKLHVKSSLVWDGYFSGEKFYIEALEDMMSYYNLKPYHVALLSYTGGGEFNLIFYTPYSVEMKYPPHNSGQKFDLQCNALEEDKLASIFRYNVITNFTEVYSLLIEQNHLLGSSYTKVKRNHMFLFFLKRYLSLYVYNSSLHHCLMQVLSDYGCYKLHLTNKVKFVRLGFEKHEWKIKLKWVDREVFFDDKWFEFIHAAEIVPGDILVIHKTTTAFKFKVALSDRRTVSQQVHSGGITLSI